MEKPSENSELIENAAAETKEDTGVHAEESTKVGEDQSDDVENEKPEPGSDKVDLAEEEPEHADLANIADEPNVSVEPIDKVKTFQFMSSLL